MIFKSNINQKIQLATNTYNAGKLDEAEKLYREILEILPQDSSIHNNLGNTLQGLGKLEEANKIYRKAIKLKPDYTIAHYNLANNLFALHKFEEAELSYKKAIQFKPDFIEALNNLGSTQRILKKFKGAIINYKKIIKINPMVSEWYNNLGAVLVDLNKYDEAEKNYRKAIELDSNNMEPRDALITLSKQKKLLNLIKKRKVHVKNNIKSLKSVSAKLFDPNLRLSPNPFIFNRAVETELLTNHYKINFKELNKTKDGRYGNGKCSDFQFFENDLTIIKTVAEDLTNIMSLAVKSDIFIFDSFLNIYRAGSGTTPHTHLNQFDKVNKLTNQKYSLTYYLSVGDQNCSEPGNLQLYDPSEEIKLSEGTLVIIPATRKHAAVYNGSKDRVMIGVNFYSLI
tara:strand:+ start:67 stop:1260 length:1194 start_codon:yes stop_codon:yes gene_type:complete